jgi:sugar lactone lactonase YvrE
MNFDKALIVVNLRDGSARRVLAGHVSVMSENVDLIVEDKPVRLRQSDGSYANARVSVNPIALDANNDWLYYGPMTGSRLYRIRTADLVNQQLTSEQLAERVENYAARPNSDGISIDRDNNIYITEIGANAIGVIRPNP